MKRKGQPERIAVVVGVIALLVVSVFSVLLFTSHRLIGWLFKRRVSS
jgi:hypothetical protein